jgi:protein-disulfide isomerase
LNTISRVPAKARSLAGLAALACFALLYSAGDVMAQREGAALVAAPVSLPDMVLGSEKAPVTIVEYASMTCSHCAAFDQNVFPMVKSKYIDTGKVRFVFREFPLDVVAAAASMLARCIGNNDAEKYFGVIDLLFKQQDQLIAQPKETLQRIGKQSGMSDQAVDACETNQAQLDKISADAKFANETLKVDATPTLFINGEMMKGGPSFEELDNKIVLQLKK